MRCVVLLFGVVSLVFAAQPPDELAVRMFVKPDTQKLHLLLRVPLKSLNGITLPVRSGNGELDLARTGALLPSAARWWIAASIDVYEGDARLPMPTVAGTMVSLPSDSSFLTYESALAHVMGAPLPDDTQVFRDQAMLDALFDYPIASERSHFAIHSKLDRLAARVSTNLTFIPPSGPARSFEFQGDPGRFAFEPGWLESVQRFARSGFRRILNGSDYLLFLFCVALLLRTAGAVLPFITAFAGAVSVTLIASAYNLASDALWFPPLILALIAASIVYMAFECIAGGVIVRRRWVLAVGFGLVYGFGSAFALKQSVQFAGSHVLASILSYNVGLDLAQFAVLGVLMIALDLMFRIPVEPRAETIVLAALAADVAWHRTTERFEQLGQYRFTLPSFDAALLANAMSWLTIFLGIAGVAALVKGVRQHLAQRATAKAKQAVSSF